jgi:timeless
LVLFIIRKSSIKLVSKYFQFKRLEHHTKKNGTLSVMSKKKQRKLKKKKSKKDNKKKAKKETKEEKEKRLKEEAEFNKRLDEQTEGFKEKIWSKSFSKVASLIQSETELNIENDQLMPFEFVATSDQEFDAQKDIVIEKIQHLLASNKPDDSIALFREARCLWPNDKELFGQAQAQADEEFETYKNLFMKKLEIKRPLVEEKENEKEEDEDEEEEKKKKDQDDEGIEDDLNNDLEGDGQEENKSANEYNSEDEDEEENGYVLQEEDLEFDKFLFRYTNPRILRSFILMLGEYAKNSDFLNRCCMSMFERISYECHAPQCLYQLSLFHLINKIHKDPMSRCIMNILDDKTLTQKRSIDDLYASTYTAEDMLAFFRQLIKKFFVQLKTNPKLYAEVLFFKDKRIIFELSEESNGYQPLDSGKNKNGKHRKVAWSEEEQDELKDLFEKYRGKFEKDQDGEIDSSNNDNSSQTDENADLIDLIMLNIKDGSRQRREICLQLFNMK